MVKYIKGVNDLASQKPELISQWDYDKNEIDPTTLIVGSGKRVWWKCKKGHSWQAEIYRRSAGAGCPYCAGQKVIVGENDLETTYPLMAKEWNYEKNGELSPKDVMGQSGKKVWWKCAFGHEWKVSPNSRVSQNSGCPICSSEYKTSFPEQAILYYVGKYTEVISRYIVEGMEIDIFMPKHNVGIEYDGIYFHNNDRIIKKEKQKEEYCIINEITLIRIKEFKTGQEKSIVRTSNAHKLFYRNLEDGKHSLDNVIRELLIWMSTENIIYGEIDVDVMRDKEKIWAQYISIKKENSLEESYPIIAKEWNQEKNRNLKPSQVLPNSHKKVWWICPKGHEWETTLSHRVEGNGCPYCSHQKYLKGFNDLFTLYPQIAAEWDYEHNELRPEEVLGGGQRKYWWRCSKGHEWEASIRKRVDGRNCPVCVGKKVIPGINDLKTVCPYLITEWNYKKNNIIPENVAEHSNKKVWWVCKDGHEWEMTINARVAGRGCPQCAKKKRVETRIKNSIKKKGSLFDVYPNVAREWNIDKNTELTPNDCTPKSNRKVWWMCEEGHEWQATINNRSSGQGCPVCSKKRK